MCYPSPGQKVYAAIYVCSQIKAAGVADCGHVFWCRTRHFRSEGHLEEHRGCCTPVLRLSLHVFLRVSPQGRLTCSSGAVKISLIFFVTLAYKCPSLKTTAFPLIAAVVYRKTESGTDRFGDLEG